MPNRNNKGKKVVISRSRKEKKPTMLLEVAKDEILGESKEGFEVIKKIRRFGKYYVLVKRN
ncbi:Conserved hypothetical protein [Clostridium neonatale]|uniref:hypothetical protein n=1 Tax=Clostridium neonatale TaxID=137838 RepID=UPI00291BA991|nr:Conserved hypothetical protein [Clostridium neonatale]